MALSTLVPTTVSSISLLAKSAIPGLQIWSLHGLLLTIEAAGLSFVSHVQVINFMTLDSRLTQKKADICESLCGLDCLLPISLEGMLELGVVIFVESLSV